MAPSAEICGSGGNAAACGSRLGLSGTLVCPAGSADFRSHSFIRHLLEVNKPGSIKSREHFKNTLPKCGSIAGIASCGGNDSKRELAAIPGKSGSGKSTLLNILAGAYSRCFIRIGYTRFFYGIGYTIGSRRGLPDFSESPIKSRLLA